MPLCLCVASVCLSDAHWVHADRLPPQGDWNAKQPRARQAKSKSRSEAFVELQAANEQRMNDRTMSAATAGASVDLGAAAEAAAKAQAVGAQRKRPGGGGTKGASAERYLGEKVNTSSASISLYFSRSLSICFDLHRSPPISLSTAECR